MGEKKLHRNKSKPLQIPYFKSIARESKIHLLCPLTTVQNVKLLTQVNTQQNTGKPKKKKKEKAFAQQDYTRSRAAVFTGWLWKTTF